jgi:glycine amidinotransferase
MFWSHTASRSIGQSSSTGGQWEVQVTALTSAFSWACRRHEIELAHGTLLKRLEGQAYTIVRPPHPPEPDTIFDVEVGVRWVINNSRIAFDTADFVRAGIHVIGQLSNTTNQKGVDFVRAHLPAGYELIIIECMDDKEMHIDATFMPIGPGTALYNPKAVTIEELRRRKPLNTWRLLPKPADSKWSSYPPPYMCRPLLGINVLMLDEKHVFCEEDDKDMHVFWRELGIEPIPLPFKHVHSLGGLFHCATADLRR